VIKLQVSLQGGCMVVRAVLKTVAWLLVSCFHWLPGCLLGGGSFLANIVWWGQCWHDMGFRCGPQI